MRLVQSMFLREIFIRSVLHLNIRTVNLLGSIFTISPPNVSIETPNKHFSSTETFSFSYSSVFEF